MDQSASEMSQMLSGNLLDVLHCFIIALGIRSAAIVGLAENLTIVSTVVTELIIRLGFGSTMVYLTALAKPYSCHSSTNMHYTPEDIYSAAQ